MAQSDLKQGEKVIATVYAPRNRRKSPRFFVDKRLKIKVVPRSQESLLHGRIRDLSEGGLSAIVSGLLNAGEQTMLEFPDADGNTLVLAAVVCHRKGFYYGLQFSNPTAEQRQAIVKICTREGKPGA